MVKLKNDFMIFLLFSSIHGFSFGMCADSILALKDTVIDCFSIKVRYSNGPMCKKDFFVGSTVDKKRTCKKMNKENNVPSVQFDSIKMAEIDKQKQELFYLNGKVQESNTYTEGDEESLNRIFIYDTTIDDTIYKVFLDSKFKGDSLINRDVKIDKNCLK